jgi:colanic acid/amylovoran biosynthesis glycosyltransferase
MRIAYVVSRFPHVSETFIVRELDAVSADPDIEVELMSLFPAASDIVHPAAERWLPLLQGGSLGGGLAGLVAWAVTRPIRLITSIAATLAGYWRRPGHAWRALVTLVVAAGHARVLRSRRVDHVHAHYATYPALAAWFCHRLVGVNYSLTAHAHDIYVDQSMLARKLADAAFVVTVSEFNRRWLRERFSELRTPIHVVHCGIEPADYPFRPRTVPPRGPVTALTVASLQEYKGHATLLRALSGDGELDRVELELIGEGRLQERLERLSAQLGLSARVRFEGGRSEAEVRQRLAAADLFVLPSIVARDGQMEGLPVALMEAMAAGVPVVASRLSGIPELVIDGETGLLAEPGSSESLRTALATALSDPDAAAKRLDRARRLVEESFDIADTGAQMASLFKATARPARTPG